jgi:hypothetical protein
MRERAPRTVRDEGAMPAAELFVIRRLTASHLDRVVLELGGFSGHGP